MQEGAQGRNLGVIPEYPSRYVCTKKSEGGKSDPITSAELYHGRVTPSQHMWFSIYVGKSSRSTRSDAPKKGIWSSSGADNRGIVKLVMHHLMVADPSEGHNPGESHLQIR